MTDGRFPERWLTDRRFTGLPQGAIVLFVTANTWSAGNRTDGLITKDDLESFPRWVEVHHPDVLVKHGLWEVAINGWTIVDYDRHQITAEELDRLERNRVAERKKKARQRARTKAEVELVPGDIPRDIPGDVTGEYAGQDRTGQDRSGRGSEEAEIERENPRYECMFCHRTVSTTLLGGKCRNCQFANNGHVRGAA